MKSDVFDARQYTCWSTVFSFGNVTILYYFDKELHAGVVDEAEDANSSGTHGLILLVLFSGVSV